MAPSSTRTRLNASELRTVTGGFLQLDYLTLNEDWACRGCQVADPTSLLSALFEEIIKLRISSL